MMKILVTKPNAKFLSNDLRAFENFMLSRGYSAYYLSLLKRGPEILFEIYGALGSLDFLSNQDYRTKFKKLLEDRYQPGTLRRLSYGIRHYHDYLVEIGALNQKDIPKWRKTIIRKEFHFYHNNLTSYYRDIENSYLEHMNIEKELCADEIRKRLACYKKFVSLLIEKEISTFEQVRGNHILEFSRSKKTLKTNWNYLKYFLRFAYRQGYILEDFSFTVIPRKNARILKKRFLEDDKVDAILQSLRRETTIQKRDFTMVSLMARLGLRPSETIRIKLEHIDWVNSKILIHGKNKTEDWLPLTEEIAEPIIDYLKNSSEIRNNHKYLFLGLRPPFRRLKTHTHLTEVLSDAYENTNIQPPSGDVRLNVFRHSKATSIVNSEGQNFFTAQTLLRHSSSEMTMHYAKYHSKRQPLFEVDWPEYLS